VTHGLLQWKEGCAQAGLVKFWQPRFVWGSRQATYGCPANGWWPLLAAQRSAIDEVSVKELPDPRYFKAAGLVQRSVEDI